MTESPDSTEPADGDSAVADGPPPSSRGFPAALVAVAVFPFALAIGFTTRTVAPPPATLEAAQQPLSVPAPNRIETGAIERQLADHDRIKGDNLFRAGRFESALHFYRSLGSSDSLRIPPDLLVRIAMCQEGLGLWDEALAGYRTVAGCPNSSLKTAGILGQARIWLRLHNFANAEPLLRRQVVESGDRKAMPANVAPDVIVLSTLAFAAQVLSQENLPADDMAPAMKDVIDSSFEQTITLADVDSSQSPANVPATSDARTTTPSAMSMDRDESAPEQTDRTGLLHTELRISVRDLSYAELMERIVAESGMKMIWLDVAHERAAGRKTNLWTEQVPSSLLLTVLCRDIATGWVVDVARRTVSISDIPATTPNRDVALSMAEATLVDMIDSSSSERLTGPMTFVLARLAETQGRDHDAGRLYASLVGPSASALAVRAAYNAGLVYQRLGDLREAGKMLEVVVHGAPGHELHSTALILYGRLLIEQGQFQEAAFQLKRAAEFRNPPEVQIRAAVFCAMAQLLNNRPNDAADVLFAHRLQFQDRTIRNAAALMNSLARSRTVADADRDREAQFLYRSIAAVEPESDWLGPSGQLLLGQAMIEAGLDDQMADLFRNSLQNGVSQRVADEMSLYLADYWHAHSQAKQAKEVWTRLYATNGPGHLKSGLRLAELALEKKDAKTCLEICRDVMHIPGVPRTEVLKLGGRAFELSGHESLAAQCYAGQWPMP